LSGRRELNPVYTHPKRAYYRHTPARHRTPPMCSILELVRTAFAAAGGEEIPPRKFGKVVQTLKGLQTRWAAEPHR